MGCNGCAWEWLSRFLGVLCVNSVSQGLWVSTWVSDF